MKSMLSLALIFTVSLTFISCSSTKDLIKPLTSNPWVLSTLMGSSVEASDFMGRLPSLSFQDNGKVSGFSGCNNFNGNFKLEGTGLSIDPGAMTRKMCPGNGEEDFLKAISQVKNLAVDRDKLSLTDGVKEVMSFVPFQ